MTTWRFGVLEGGDVVQWTLLAKAPENRRVRGVPAAAHAPGPQPQEAVIGTLVGMKFTMLPHVWKETIDQLTEHGHEYVPYEGHVPEGTEFIVFNGTAADFPEELPESVGFVHTHFAGVDSLVKAGYLTPGKLRWSNAQGLYADTVAESTLGLLLGVTQMLKTAITTASWDAAEEMHENKVWLFNSKVAVVGAGGIGSAIVPLLKAFGATVQAVTHSGREIEGADESLAMGEFNWGEPDIIITVTPLTKETHHMVNAETLKKMKDTAIVINVGRGPLVDTDALTEALTSGTIAAAGLDVLEPEPLPADHPLWKLNNCLITPHVANTNPVIRHRTGLAAAASAEAFERGERMPTEVDPQRGY